MTPPFALPPPDFPLPAYVRQVESGLLMPDKRFRSAVLPGMYPTPGLIGRSAPPPVLTYLTTIQRSENASSYSGGNLNGISIGDPDASRRIIVGLSHNEGGNAEGVTSVTVGGVSSTLVVKRRNEADNSRNTSEIWISDPLISGTTANVAITLSPTVHRLLVHLWRVVNLKSPIATDVATSASNPATLSLDFAAGGVGVAVSHIKTGSGASWTGMIMRVNAVHAEGYSAYSAADYTATTAETGRTISMRWNSGSYPASVAASFR